MSTTANRIGAYFSDVSLRFAERYDLDDAFRERYEVWTQLLNRYSAGRQTAIDLGCGSGIFSFHLADRGLSVTGIDAAEGMVDLCRQQHSRREDRPGVERSKQVSLQFHQAELPELTGVEVEPADLVIASSVLEYVPDLPSALRRIRHLVRDDGAVIVSLPNRESCYRRLEHWRYMLTGQPAYYEFVQNVVTIDQLTRYARTAGLVRREHEYYAHDTRICALLRGMRLPQRWTENLLVAVFQPAR